MDRGDLAMAINLPHWLVDIMGVLGFNWPEIDEDQLREAATRVGPGGATVPGTLREGVGRVRCVR